MNLKPKTMNLTPWGQNTHTHALVLRKSSFIHSFSFTQPFIQHCFLYSRHGCRSWGFRREPSVTNIRAIPSAGKWFRRRGKKDGWFYTSTPVRQYTDLEQYISGYGESLVPNSPPIPPVCHRCILL